MDFQDSREDFKMGQEKIQGVSDPLWSYEHDYNHGKISEVYL